MAKQDTKGKVQTVLGLIDCSQLGITLPHEHLFFDGKCLMMEEPINPEEKKLAHQKVTMETLSFNRYHRFSNEDNLMLNDEDMAIREVMYFKEAGGKTIVDMTCINTGRSPGRLLNVAEATGLNIIMGTAYYIAQSYTPEMKINSRTEEDIAAEFIRDIIIGTVDTSIKAGIIGEIGLSWPIEEGEIKVLRAAGIAQQETGVAINIHPGAHEDAPFEYIKVLEDTGADLSHVVFSHMSCTFPMSTRYSRANLAEKGCYLEYDMFGGDGNYPTPIGPYDVANDTIRVNQIIELIEDGFLDRILISQDIFLKILLRSYGGAGYSHILNIIIPQKMQAKGITEEQINTIMVENPKDMLPFR